LYPLLPPDIYDLFHINENGYQEQSNMDVPPHGIHIDKSDDYIRSEDCQDEYKLSGNEYPLWHAIDVSSCNGASMSQAFAREWMPMNHPLPLGCPLKDISSVYIRDGEGLEVTLDNAYQIHIYVDGVFCPDGEDSSKCFNCADSCNAAWAFAVIAVDEQLNGKLICSSGGHVTFNEDSSVFLGEDNPSSFDPELYAHVMARMYLLQHKDHFNAPIYIGYDNISAADCSFMK